MGMPDWALEEGAGGGGGLEEGAGAEAETAGLLAAAAGGAAKSDGVGSKESTDLFVCFRGVFSVRFLLCERFEGVELSELDALGEMGGGERERENGWRERERERETEWGGGTDEH